MRLEFIDWISIIAFFVISLAIGLIASKRAGENSSEFFLSGRHMPWWLLGVSMVATTFSTDTPNLVTDIVRDKGVAGNWEWLAFVLTGMLTVFVYAKLWRRSKVMTDVEFYELRYSGKTAAFLRGFRAIYLGFFYNVIIMASVTLAAIKIGGVMLNLTPLQTISIAAVITVFYSMLGGLTGVLFADFIQFGIAMFGAIMAAIIAVRMPEIGGLNNLLSRIDPQKISLLPDFSDTNLVIAVLVIPFAVQWWSVWYPGAEPGGGGYLVQRMLAAKNERHSMGATLFFNIAHYALRPWPWILVALCSMIVFPDLNSLQEKFPHIKENIIRHDLAYPAMLTFLPHGLLGLVVASLMAAYMSTISTHLNWGSSYLVNDFYRRFIHPQATEKRLVLIGRISTVILMIAACSLAPFLENAKRAFNLLLQIGAGTGLIFILRWFWWRINAISEITAMIVSFIVAFYFEFIHIHTGLQELEHWQKLILGVGLTTISWIIATLITQPVNDNVLFNFYRVVCPGGPGWKAVLLKAKAKNEIIENADEKWDMPYGILCMVFGCFVIFGAFFATGSYIYGHYIQAILLTVISVTSVILLLAFWKHLKFK